MKKTFIFLKNIIVCAIGLAMTIYLLMNNGVLGGDVLMGTLLSYLGAWHLFYFSIIDDYRKNVKGKPLNKRKILKIFQYILFALLLIYGLKTTEVYMRRILNNELDLVSGGSSVREELRGIESAATHSVVNGVLLTGVGRLLGPALPWGAATSASAGGIIGTAGTLGYYVGHTLYNNSETVQNAAIDAWESFDRNTGGIISGNPELNFKS